MEQPSFWVVETARSTYWDGRQGNAAAYFTPDINEAMKFYSFNDAERARCWLLAHTQDTLCSVEHMFIEMPAKQSAA